MRNRACRRRLYFCAIESSEPLPMARALEHGHFRQSGWRIFSPQEVLGYIRSFDANQIALFFTIENA
jgi:hypothetical protein